MNELLFVGDLVVPSGTVFRVPRELSETLVFNLEGPLTRSEEGVGGKICLKQDPDSFASVFTEAKPLAACLANNHIMDFGRIGLEDTIHELKNLGISFFGAGTLAERGNNPLVLSVGGTAVGLMGYVCSSTHPVFATDEQPGVVPPELDRIRIDVANARSLGAEVIVISIHWGAEEVEYPKPSDIRLASELAALGVDLVIGHHAHCRQPWGRVGATQIFFGLGNAYFPDFSIELESGVEAWGKQRVWNRTSYLVELAPKTRMTKVHQLVQNAKTWSVSHDVAVRRIIIEDNAACLTAHDTNFRRAYRAGMARLAISRFIARPRLPKLSSLGYLLRALKHGARS